eukprot:1156780-Pelagomonas_calceolata.AAC.2
MEAAHTYNSTVHAYDCRLQAARHWQPQDTASSTPLAASGHCKQHAIGSPRTRTHIATCTLATHSYDDTPERRRLGAALGAKHAAAVACALPALVRALSTVQPAQHHPPTAAVDLDPLAWTASCSDAALAAAADVCACAVGLACWLGQHRYMRSRLTDLSSNLAACAGVQRSAVCAHAHWPSAEVHATPARVGRTRLK